MNKDELAKLQKEHEKAMEAIKAFNKEARGLNSVINKTLGK